LKVRPELLGKLVRCKRCDHHFTAVADPARAPDASGRQAKEAAGHRSEIDALRRERDEAVVRAGEAASERDGLRERVAGLEGELADVRRESAAALDPLRADRDRLAGELAACRLEASAGLDSLRSDRDRLAADLTEARGALESERMRSRRLEVDLGSERAAREREEGRRRETESERDRIAAERDEARYTLETDSARSEALAVELAEAREALETERRERVSAERERDSVPVLVSGQPPGPAPEASASPFDWGRSAPDRQPAASDWEPEETPSEDDRRIDYLMNLTAGLHGQVKSLTAEVDTWKREAERLRAEAGAVRHAPGSDDEAVRLIERQLAAAHTSLRAEKARADSLHLRLAAAHADALDHLAAEADAGDEALALARELAEARDEIMRLRARLVALGKDPNAEA
jgi:chromosome segregation ATPase